MHNNEIFKKKIDDGIDKTAADKTWGSIKWCCIQRDVKQQASIVEDMKKGEMWDEQMESLPNNLHDTAWKNRQANMAPK